MDKAPCRRVISRAISLAAVLLFAISSISSTLAAPEPEPIIAQAKGDSIRLHWEAPLYQGTQVVGGDGRTYLLPQVSGWSLTSEPGAPQLPYVTALVALPPEGTPRLQVSAGKSDAYALPYPLYPAPSALQQSVFDVHLPEGASVWAYDAEAYAADTWTPSESVTFQRSEERRVGKC